MSTLFLLVLVAIRVIDNQHVCAEQKTDHAQNFDKVHYLPPLSISRICSASKNISRPFCLLWVSGISSSWLLSRCSIEHCARRIFFSSRVRVMRPLPFRNPRRCTGRRFRLPRNTICHQHERTHRRGKCHLP